MAIGKELLELQKSIGYNFSDLSLLEKALTHSSFTNEQRTRGITLESNERLEFLGDAVLEIVISEYLFHNFKTYREGALTKLRQQLVCEKFLSKIATEIDLGSYINIGNGEETNGGRTRPKILADCLEAVFAAIYIDSLSRNSNEYIDVIVDLIKSKIDDVANNQGSDFKTMLQQLVEKDGSSLLEYKILKEDGPEHDKIFVVEAFINNNLVGTGTAKNKKEAEMQAAKAALGLFGILV